MKADLKNSKSIYRITFCILVFILFAVWLFNSMYLGPDGTSYKMFFRGGTDFMADTTNVVGYSSERDVYNDTHFTDYSEKAYPPLQYVLSWFLSKTVPSFESYYDSNSFTGLYKESTFLIIYMIICFIIAVMFYEVVRTVTNGNNLIKVCTAAAVLASAPMLYAMERANSIILVVAFVMLYIFFYDSSNKYLKELALISLAIAASFKITPALLGILLIYDKKWKEAIRAVIYGVLFMFVPFAFIRGGFGNVPLFIRNITMNLDAYGITGGVTLTAAVINVFGIGKESFDTAISVLKPVTYVVSALMLASAPMYKRTYLKVLAVTLTLVILPSHSGSYCILFLIPAILAFLNEEEHKVYDIAVFVGFMLIALTYFDYYQQLLKGLLVLVVTMTILSAVTIIKCIKNIKVK